MAGRRGGSAPAARGGSAPAAPLQQQQLQQMLDTFTANNKALMQNNVSSSEMTLIKQTQMNTLRLRFPRESFSKDDTLSNVYELMLQGGLLCQLILLYMQTVVRQERWRGHCTAACPGFLVVCDSFA